MSPATGPTPIEAHLALAFALQATPGTYAVLLGAGVSTAAGMPSAWDVQQELLASLAQARGEKPDDLDTWYEETYGQAANL